MLVLAIGFALISSPPVIVQHDGHPMGAVDFPISCSPRAQTEFNRAVTLLHHMTYPQARSAFQNVATIDPRCAMAHWGVAMTLFQPVWPTRPGPDARQQGWREVETAKSLAAPTSREQLFIAAAEAFFLDPSADDLLLWNVDDVVFVLDEHKQPLVGTIDFSYTLNRSQWTTRFDAIASSSG